MYWISSCTGTTTTTTPSGDTETWLNSLPFAANDGDAVARGIAIGKYYKASGPVSSEASIASGGNLQPNTMGEKEGAIMLNVGLS